MKVFINIMTWVGQDSTATHYYGTIYINYSDTNIYKLIEERSFGKKSGELSYALNEEDAELLNKKYEDSPPWQVGEETIKFNSVEHLKNTAKEMFPDSDIAFLSNFLLIFNDDVIIRSKETIKPTGKKLRIHNFRGFSTNFENLTEGSEHEIIETPERYKGKDLQPGYWVNGVYEPALILKNECILI